MEINNWYVIAILLNVIVSLYIFKHDDLNRFQKISQVIIIWLLPYLGAIGIFALNKSLEGDLKPPGNDNSGGGSDSSSW